MGASRVFVQDFIRLILHFTVFYGLIIIGAMPVIGDDRAAFWCLLAFVPFFINFLIRRYIRSTVLMLIAHLLVPTAAFFMVGDIIMRVFVMVILAVFTVYSLASRATGGEEVEAFFGIVSSLVMVVLSFLALYYGHRYAAFIYPALVAVIGVGYTLHIRMARVDMSLDAITKTSVQPIRQILRFDHKMMATFVFVLIAITLIGRLVLIDPVLELVSSISLPQQAGADGPGMVFTPQSPLTPHGDIHQMLGQGYTEPHPFWEIFDMVITILVQAAVVALLLTMLISGAFAVYKLMSYRNREIPYRDGEDEKVFVIPERVKRARGNLRSVLSRFSRQEDRTRRIFRKKVRRHMKMGVPILKSDTPTLIAEKIKSEDITALAEEYKRVRY